MSEAHYNVALVKPDNQLIEAGSEEVTHSSGIEVKAGKMKSGRWIAWVPYYERPSNLCQGTVRAIAENKFVATGAVLEEYEE